MFVAKVDAVGEGNTRAVVAAYPKPGHRRLGSLELFDDVGVAELILWNGSRPQLDAEDLGWRRVRLQKHLAAALVHLGHDLVVAQLGNANIARAADVVEKDVPFRWAAARKER